MELNKRQMNMDALRVIAAVAVVFIHAASYSSQVTFAFFNAVTRFSVPVFFMISGYFMLGRDASPKTALGKVLKLFVIMLLWSGVYAAYDIAVGAAQLTSLKDLIKLLLIGPVHFWYFYAAMVLYLLTPLLSVFCKNADRRTYVYVLALFFLFGCIVRMALQAELSPTLAALLEKAKFSAQTGFLFCFMLGYYFRRFKVSRTVLSIIYVLGAFGAVLTFVGALGSLREYAISFYSPAVVITAAALFAAFAYRSRNYAWASLAPYTGGVFVIHVLILRIVNSCLQPLFTDMGFAYVLCTGAAATVLSFALTFVLKKIPFVKKLII